jgi:hypothetical protein
LVQDTLILIVLLKPLRKMVKVYQLLRSKAAVETIKRPDGSFITVEFSGGTRFLNGRVIITDPVIQFILETRDDYGKNHICITRGVKVAKKGDKPPWEKEKKTIPEALQVTVDALKKREEILDQRAISLNEKETRLKDLELLLNVREAKLIVKKPELKEEIHDDLAEKINLNDAEISAVTNFKLARIFLIKKYPDLSPQEVMSIKAIFKTCSKKGIVFPNFKE